MTFYERYVQQRLPLNRQTPEEPTAPLDRCTYVRRVLYPHTKGTTAPAGLNTYLEVLRTNNPIVCDDHDTDDRRISLRACILPRRRPFVHPMDSFLRSYTRYSCVLERPRPPVETRDDHPSRDMKTIRMQEDKKPSIYRTVSTPYETTEIHNPIEGRSIFFLLAGEQLPGLSFRPFAPPSCALCFLRNFPRRNRVKFVGRLT